MVKFPDNLRFWPRFWPRFWLFAPFVGLMALGLVAFGLWHYTAGRIVEAMAGQGLSWQTLSRSGFPARITLDMQTPRYHTDTLMWQNDRLRATLMPFNARHAVIDFGGAHRLTNAHAQMRLAHTGNLASAVFDLAGLLRASFEAQNPHLVGSWRDVPLAVKADSLGLHTKRADKAERYQLAIALKNLRGLGARAIERLDVTGQVPWHMLNGAAKAGDRVRLDRLVLERNGLTVVARGRVLLAADGYFQGKLDLDLVNVEALVATLEEAGLIDADERAKWLFFGGLGAALGGDTQDRLSVPLRLENQRIQLGPLDLGRAPRWR